MNLLPGLLLSITLATAAAAHAAPVCRTTEGDMESTTICRYADSDLAQAYRLYRSRLPRSEQAYLLAQIPRRNTDVKPASHVQVHYRWRKNGLYIEQNFDGGVTYITFTQRGRNVEVKTIGSPD